MNGLEQVWISKLQRAFEDVQLRQGRLLARASFAPQLAYGRHFCPPISSAKSAAVMILLHLHNHQLDWTQANIPLTVRPLHLPDHPGQISFPGGRLEAGEDFLDAAKREFEEELGISRFPGIVVGRLEPIWVFNSNYWLTAFVAVHAGPLDFRPCEREVARLIRLPVSRLVQESAIANSTFSRGSVSWKSKVIRYQDDIIWGVTGMILGELSMVLRSLQIGQEAISAGQEPEPKFDPEGLFLESSVADELQGR